jgi:hypothetical protein
VRRLRGGGHNDLLLLMDYVLSRVRRLGITRLEEGVFFILFLFLVEKQDLIVFVTKLRCGFVQRVRRSLVQKGNY